MMNLATHWMAVDRRSRQNIRKALKNCRVEPISFERLAEEDWVLEMDTRSRQERQVPISEETWRRPYMSATNLPGFEPWGALVDGRVVASLLTFQMEDCCEMISQQCHRDYLNARVNNALSFVVTQAMINRTGIRSVFYTLQSLDDPASVDRFKFCMGYIAKPVRQRVVLNPLFEPFSNSFIHSIAARLLQRNPGNGILAKAEGMLRFHLQGKRRLKEQDFPECLVDRKIKLFEELNFCE